MDIKIKKELSENEFLKLMAECEKKISTTDNKKELISFCTSIIQRIIPADIIYLVKVTKEDEDIYILEYADITKKLSLSDNDNSIITEALRSKQPLISNDIQISFIYNKKIDDLLNDSEKKLKDLLVVPITDTDNTDVVAMIWAATYSDNLNQFIQKDMDYMIRFSPVIRKLLKNDSLVFDDSKTVDEESDSLKECLQIQEKLRKELKYKDLYFSSIIHDVRAPMNALLGFLDLLKLKEKDEIKIDYIESAIKSGENIVTLINDALDLAKIKSGKMDINKTEFSPHKDLEDSAQIFANASLKKGICFSTYFDPALPEIIISDPMRIRQIINNLLSNALKFTPNGGSIDLEIIYDAKIDGMTVKVQDSGIGIPKEKQSKIFAPFEQESSETAQKYGGTGLGLSIAMQLTIRLGGKLQLKSKEGKGSLFYFTIPCNTPPLVKATYERDILHSKSIAVYQKGKCKNIINSINRYIEYMTDSGYKIDKFDKYEYDTVFISKESAIEYQDKIFEALKNNVKFVIFGCDNTVDDDCIFDKKVEKINTPILPNTIIRSINGEKRDNNKLYDSMIEETKKKLSGKVALTADDNPINLKFMQELFKSLDVKMLSASDGDEAVKEYVKNHDNIDIIFMDENMNKVNGSEAIKAIREFEKNEEIENVIIIGLTGDALRQTRDKMIDAGADDVLVKPVRLDNLIEKLEMYLSK